MFCLLGAVLAARVAGGEEKEQEVLKRARKLAEEREKLEEELIAIVKQKQEDYDERVRQREAIELLGRIGTARCVPVLVEVLHDYFEPTPPGVTNVRGITIVRFGSPPTPAMQALAALGPLAVESLLGGLEKEPHVALVETWEQGLRMLQCRELVIAATRRRIEEEKDGEIRKRLRSLLIMMRDYAWVERLDSAGKETERNPRESH